MMIPDSAILLIDPKYDRNVGAVLRAAHCFGASELRWTGRRVSKLPVKGGRLPREERMRQYRNVKFHHDSDEFTVIDRFEEEGFVPVCMEISPSAIALPRFEHPERALYVFGPEDNDVPKGIRLRCHQFVRIPTASRTPLNLACAVNVTLAFRYTQFGNLDLFPTEYAEIIDRSK